MLSPQDFANAFARNTQIIKLQTANLTQEESLLQLPFRGNCMNWIVGHIAINRLDVLKLIGAEPDFDHTGLDRYQRESDPMGPDSLDALPLTMLMTILDNSQTQIALRLAEITPEELEHQLAFLGTRSQSVSAWLFFYYFHDTYHTGQTEILRQATGKNDKII